MTDNRTDLLRGEDFAEAIHAAVSEHGPQDLTPREQAALAHHLIITATDWVRRRNRLSEAGQ